LEFDHSGDAVLANLLESKSVRDRSGWSALISAAAHTAIIALAIVATAQARTDVPRDTEIVRWINPPAPSAPATPATPAKLPSVDPPARATLPGLRLIDRISVTIPSVDPLATLPSLNSDQIAAGLVAPTSTSLASGPVGTAEPLTADQVEKQVSLRPGSPPPRYPDALRAGGVEGEVVAVFVVNERGRAEPGSLRFIRSANALFETAVRDALANLRFVPAEVGGRKVRQLVQMPFVFRLSR
jgi:protein TonB